MMEKKMKILKNLVDVLSDNCETKNKIIKSKNKAIGGAITWLKKNVKHIVYEKALKEGIETLESLKKAKEIK